MQPLSGIRVLAVEQYLAGNIGSLYLSRFGAEVIKLEQPTTGDALRSVGPMHQDDDGFRSASELRTMAGKKSIAIDLASSDGIDAFWRLVPAVDVVWTNMKPSSLRKLGIDFEQLKQRNPEIVYATLSGFGHDDLLSSGPFGDWTAFDLIAQGLAGIQFRGEGGDEPSYNGLPLGDFVTAIMTAMGTVMALLRRQREGGAQRVDVAMHDAMVALNELPLGLLAFNGEKPPRGRSGTSAPYGSYPTSDGFVNIAIGGDPIWRRFCKAIGHPELADDERYRRARDRVANYAPLHAFVGEWALARTTAEIVDLLVANNVPGAPVFDLPAVLASPQVASRNMLIDIADPRAGRRQIVGSPIKMSDVDDRSAPPPPDLGQDTRSVLRSLAGFTDAEIEQLSISGAIGVLDR
ncbi:MAG: CoA transferase [Sphingomonadales bacterium]|nr:CoA transferase [Sphingomonadales bacterium]